MSYTLLPITYRCNLKCQYCPVDQTLPDIDFDESLKTLEENKEKFEWVYITGGEPFLVEDLSDRCDSIRSLGFKVGVTTNGTFYRPLIAEHADRIGISLDGSPGYHDAYRGEGVWDKALKLFKSIKDKCEIIIMSTYFGENHDELLKLKDILKDLQPDYWQIQRDINRPELVIEKELFSI